MRRYCPQPTSPPIHTIFHLRTLTLFVLLLLIFTTSATASQVTFAWDPNTESNLAGYNLYYKTGAPGIPYEGTGLDQGDSHIAIPLENLEDRNNPSFTVSGLTAGETLYFVITAYNSDGDESPFSNEVTCQTEVPPATFTISSLARDGGSITPSGSSIFTEGSDQTYIASPADNYHIADLLVDGISVGALDTYTFTTLDSDHTITATFAIDTFSVESRAGDNGSIFPAGSIVADYNETLYFEIVPDENMQIRDLSIDGNSVGPVSEYYLSEISSNHTIEAVFEPIPEAPLADAGPDQNVEEANETRLYGSNSIDLNYEIVSYHWEQTSGTLVNITATDSVETSFVSPATGPEGEALEFCLTVTNSAGKESSDNCIVNVIRDNLPPEADSGSDQTVAEGVLVQLDGADSYDPDDSISTYQWIQVSGNLVELSNPTTATPSFTAPEVDSPTGTNLIFLLTVSDGGGLKACDRTIVNVSWSNEPPVADAGFDQTVANNTTVSLDGSGSYDNNNLISTYRWTQSQGIPVTLSDPTAIQPEFTAPETGASGASLEFRLTITDEEGLQSQAECLVEIIPDTSDTTDTTAPELTIVSPADLYATKSNSISVNGEASDNVNVEVVTWINDMGGAGVASGTEQWSISRLRLKKGYNTITITATDSAGNSTEKQIVVKRL